jgi:hypothetical protein
MTGIKKTIGFFTNGYYCDPAGTRTQGPIIKSDVLYQLSYEIDLFSLTLLDLGVQKYRNEGFKPKKNQLLFNCFKWC